MTSSVLRTPALAIQINGAPLPGVFAAEIASNNHLAADHFSVTAALAGAAGGATSPTTSLAAIADTPDLLVTVGVAIDGAPPTTLLTGAVDTLEIDPVARTLHLAGRDLSAQLIETRTQETFANQTSSEVATTLAGRHGLTPDVQATTTLIGRYWQLEHDSSTLNRHSHARTEWDLLVALAGLEGFDVWVSGSTLHFRPSPQPAAPSATLRAVATLAGPPNVLSLRLERALTLARDIRVTVKSWNSRTQSAVTATARASGGGGANTRGSGGGASRSGKQIDYVYVVPNLTAAAAQDYANRKLAEISAHERIVIAEMPGELTLAPRQWIAVEGTGTGFDQLYAVDEVERRFDLAGGFTQRIRGRSCSAS
jgi:phage protein D